MFKYSSIFVIVIKINLIRSKYMNFYIDIPNQ